jgi:hypothetical protein
MSDYRKGPCDYSKLLKSDLHNDHVLRLKKNCEASGRKTKSRKTRKQSSPRAELKRQKQ